METTSKTPLSQKIIAGLRKAATELEEFRLQAALGKAEARDVYEESKKQFNKYVQEAKFALKNAEGIAKEKSVELKTLFETLQVQLALGKADSKDVFEAQRKKITKVINELEAFIRKNKTLDEYHSRFLLEAGKFKIKLDILKLRYELNKLETRIEIKGKKKNFENKISDIKKRLLRKEEEAEAKWEHFRNEMTDAYTHLKNAFGQ